MVICDVVGTATSQSECSFTLCTPLLWGAGGLCHLSRTLSPTLAGDADTPPSVPGRGDTDLTFMCVCSAHCHSLGTPQPRAPGPGLHVLAVKCVP